MDNALSDAHVGYSLNLDLYKITVAEGLASLQSLMMGALVAQAGAAFFLASLLSHRLLTALLEQRLVALSVFLALPSAVLRTMATRPCTVRTCGCGTCGCGTCALVARSY